MIEMYVRPFFIYMRKGLASFILGLAFPRLALDSTYPSGNTEKQERQDWGHSRLLNMDQVGLGNYSILWTWLQDSFNLQKAKEMQLEALLTG